MINLRLEPACRVCGCTDRNACLTSTGPCYWVESDLCSACEAATLGGPMLPNSDENMVELYTEGDANNFIRAARQNDWW